MRWVTIRDWIDSEFSEVLLMIVHCWVEFVTVLDGSMDPEYIVYTEISVIPCSVKKRPPSKAVTIFATL